MFSDIVAFFTIMHSVFAATWFIILPVFLYYIFRSLWGRHAAIQHLMQANNVVLEIIPPRDVEKSPKIMEQFFNALVGTDKGANVLQLNLDGYMNPLFSFEIVGSEGVARFFMVTPAFFRDFVESAFYAQYPEAEVIEVPDYTKDVPAVIPNKEWTMWAVDFKLQKHDAYPIKTYKYFQEDVTGKMIDPLAPLMEAIGALGPGQHIWLQYIVQADRPQWFDAEGKGQIDLFLGRGQKSSGFFSRLWKDFMDVLSALFGALFTPPEFSPFEEGGSEEQPVEFRLTPGEKQVLTALEENISKGMFNVKMRAIILGRREGFTKSNVTSVMGATIKQFNDNHLNSILLHNPSKTDADYIFKNTIINARMRRIFDRYRDRDNSGVTFRMSTEELATVFHMPDMSVVSPSVRFIDSRRGSAPGNLPLQ